MYISIQLKLFHMCVSRHVDMYIYIYIILLLIPEHPRPRKPSPNTSLDGPTLEPETLHEEPTATDTEAVVEAGG